MKPWQNKIASIIDEKSDKDVFIAFENNETDIYRFVLTQFAISLWKRNIDNNIGHHDHHGTNIVAFTNKFFTKRKKEMTQLPLWLCSGIHPTSVMFNNDLVSQFPNSSFSYKLLILS